MHDREKMTVVPLRSAENTLLAPDESIDLGFGVSVERCQKLLASADRFIWSHKGNPDDEKEIGSWDICLVHRYTAPVGTSEAEEYSPNLLAYVLGHLRLLNPHRDSIDDWIQLERTSSGSYSSFRCAKAALHPNRFLCDCENLCWGIDRKQLDELKTLMPWIVDIKEHWEHYYPLWLSLFFIEQTYIGGQNFRIVFLFKVMALEALFCTEGSYGSTALKRRIPKFLGLGIDLYKDYQVDFWNLPTLELTTDLIRDIYRLRNKIAHADRIPDDWQKNITRRGLDNEEISYAGQLLEAAGSILRLSWLKLLRLSLQDTFSDKLKMQSYLH
jgi:hypothetical protein